MKKLILTLLSGMLPVIIFAQNPKGSFSLTPMAGINVTGLSDATTDIYKYKVRMTAGVEAEYGVNDWLGLSLGAFYSQQGAKIDFSSFSVAPDKNGIEYCYTKEKYGKLHCDYLNFPLLANIYFPKIRGLAFKIGMQMGVLVNDKLDVMTETDDYPKDPFKGMYEGNSAPFNRSLNHKERTDFCKSIDFGIPVGLSYEYRNITLNARYYFGLRKVDSTPDSDKAHNRYLSITLGYRFHL